MIMEKEAGTFAKPRVTKKHTSEPSKEELEILKKNDLEKDPATSMKEVESSK